MAIYDLVCEGEREGEISLLRTSLHSPCELKKFLALQGTFTTDTTAVIDSVIGRWAFIAC